MRGTIDAGGALHRHIVRLRLISARMVALQRTEKIAFHASSIGEEAVIVAATLAAREDDWVFPGVREWGAALVRGLPLGAYLHHAYGSAEDPASGHAAPDHPPARRVRVVPASGVIGAHLPQAVGCAWAAKIKRTHQIAIALFGHGATETGDFHNAMNFAGVFKAPCVFVCHDSRPSRTVTLADRAAAYGLACVSVDGTDAFAVIAAMQEAVARAAEGKGTTLVEAVTKPLAPSDAAIASGNVAELCNLGPDDPLVKIRRAIGEDAREDAIVQAVRAELEVAIADAERAGKPRQSTIYRDVYAEIPPHLRAQQEELASCRK
jgi:TPP-dependent pyruvate/acetoin dehydrogenase alpha subunit